MEYALMFIVGVMFGVVITFAFAIIAEKVIEMHEKRYSQNVAFEATKTDEEKTEDMKRMETERNEANAMKELLSYTYDTAYNVRGGVNDGKQ